MHRQFSPEQQFFWSMKYGIGKVWQKYCNGLTFSLQNPEKICLKLLFHATFTVLILWSFSVHVSQPLCYKVKQLAHGDYTSNSKW